MQNEAGRSGNKGTKLIMREPWDNEANWQQRAYQAEQWSKLNHSVHIASRYVS